MLKYSKCPEANKVCLLSDLTVLLANFDEMRFPTLMLIWAYFAVFGRYDVALTGAVILLDFEQVQACHYDVGLHLM